MAYKQLETNLKHNSGAPTLWPLPGSIGHRASTKSSSELLLDAKRPASGEPAARPWPVEWYHQQKMGSSPAQNHDFAWLCQQKWVAARGEHSRIVGRLPCWQCLVTTAKHSSPSALHSLMISLLSSMMPLALSFLHQPSLPCRPTLS